MQSQKNRFINQIAYKSTNEEGATTLNIITLSIRHLAFSIMTLSATKLSLCECHMLFIIMLNVSLPSVIMANVDMLSVVAS
jgi:hypothetical protein